MDFFTSYDAACISRASSAFSDEYSIYKLGKCDWVLVHDSEYFDFISLFPQFSSDKEVI